MATNNTNFTIGLLVLMLPLAYLTGALAFYLTDSSTLQINLGDQSEIVVAMAIAIMVAAIACLGTVAHYSQPSVRWRY